MFTKAFWLDAADRAARTFAQTFVAIAGVAQVQSVIHFSWVPTLDASAFAAVLSVVTSVAAGNIGAKGNPAIVAVPPTP